jgi:galacturan 1,4-alpha-galacturonidase
MDVNNIWLENFVYQGGDDCVAIKPRSYNVNIRNATCHGGNGMAIGSLGQYLEGMAGFEEACRLPLDIEMLTALDSSVENVQISDVAIVPNNGQIGNGAYIKTWIGSLALQTVGNGAYESGGVPRGGGWGVVRNILFSNFNLRGPDDGTAITQNSGHNGSAYLPSKMQVSNVAFINFTGSVSATSKQDNVIECSTTHPCYNIAYENVLSSPGNDSSFLVENNTVSASFFVPSS